MTDDQTGAAQGQRTGGALWTIKALDTGSTLLEKSMLTYTVDVGTKITVPRWPRRHHG